MKPFAPKMIILRILFKYFYNATGVVAV